MSAASEPLLGCYSRVAIEIARGLTIEGFKEESQTRT